MQFGTTKTNFPSRNQPSSINSPNFNYDPAIKSTHPSAHLQTPGILNPRQLHQLRHLLRILLLQMRLQRGWSLFQDRILVQDRPALASNKTETDIYRDPESSSTASASSASPHPPAPDETSEGLESLPGSVPGIRIALT